MTISLLANWASTWTMNPLGREDIMKLNLYMDVSWKGGIVERAS
jgi:hypothetical protein